MTATNDIDKLKKSISGMKFEEALSRLEKIIAKLENEEVDLESSLGLYDEAKLLGEHCSNLLDEAEGRVKAVGDTGELKDFE